MVYTVEHYSETYCVASILCIHVAFHVMFLESH